MMAKPNIVMKGKQLYTENRGGDWEERKTTIKDVSKNIYKPSFSLPAKESDLTKEIKKKKKPPESKEESKRPPSKVKARNESANKDKTPRKDSMAKDKKIYSKPNMSSKASLQ